MASLADKIIEYLAKHPNSKAKEIAEALRFTRRSINQALYYELEPSGAVLKNLNDEWDLSDAAKNSRTEINAKKGVIEINEDAAKALMLINSGKNVFITGKAYSVELITNHFIFNLRDLLGNNAELIRVDFCGAATSCEQIQNFLQAE